MLDGLLDRLGGLAGVSGIDPGVAILDEQALDERIESSQPVIVFFYADWCGFCRAFSEPFRETIRDAEVEAVAANISAESDPRWKRFDISVVPTLVAFRDGEEIARAGGRPGMGLDIEDLEQLLAEIEA